jgi:hypothetical protein
MIAKLENGNYNIYNENDLLIGSIKTQSNFKNAEIKVGGKTLKLTRDKWTTKVFEEDTLVYHLKTNSFFGKTRVIETEQKITGVTGFKWGTKMVDKENNTLLKIRNENHFFNNNKYLIEISNEKTSDFDILLTLYGHLHGSSMKQKAALITAIMIGIITSRVLTQ